VSRRGFTLLETMVALVILGLVVLSTVQLLGTTVRATRNVDSWTAAVAYTEEGMELAKVDLATMLVRGREPLADGFVRLVRARPAGEGLQLVSVTVLFPDGGEYTIDRLFEER
jgi:prepilin-type N-terminal cleavage/methylation domain-containing protein